MSSRSADQGSTGPIVSVVIPCYNQANYLSEAIESALEQTYSNVEVIVVDDGSTDTSAEIARRYERVRYLRQQNGGVAAACNTGIRIAAGEFIMFLGGDDRLAPDAVEKHLACFAEHQAAGFVAGDIDLIGEDGAYRGAVRPPMAKGDQYRQLLAVNHVANTVAVMFRRNVFDRAGNFDIGRQAGEDYEMILRAARFFPGAQHRHTVTEYRRHSRNMTRDGAMMLRCMLEVMHEQRPYLAEDALLRRAYKKGVRHWRRHYGVVALGQLLKQLTTAKFLSAAMTTGALLRYVRGDLVLLPWLFSRRAFHSVRRRTLKLPISARSTCPANSTGSC